MNLVIWGMRKGQKSPFNFDKTAWNYTIFVIQRLSRRLASMTRLRIAEANLCDILCIMDTILYDMLKSWRLTSSIVQNHPKPLPKIFETLPNDPFNITNHISTCKSIFGTREGQNKMFLNLRVLKWPFHLHLMWNNIFGTSKQFDKYLENSLGSCGVLQKVRVLLQGCQ